LNDRELTVNKVQPQFRFVNFDFDKSKVIRYGIDAQPLRQKRERARMTGAPRES